MKLLRELIFPLIAVLVAFVVGGDHRVLIGDNPFEVYGLLLGSALSWPDGIGYTLFYATPLIFTGLAVAVAFRCGLLNIGAEGQLYVAAFATAWVSIKFGGTVIKGFSGESIAYGCRGCERCRRCCWCRWRCWRPSRPARRGARYPAGSRRGSARTKSSRPSC